MIGRKSRLSVPFWLIACSVILFWGIPRARAENRAIILCGSGGDESFTKEFTDLAERLRRALTGMCNWPAKNIHVLLETESEGAAASTIEGIRQTFESVSKEAASTDDLY